ncbi:Octapeptide-repeat protein T2, partial [Ophiophagus hannah]
MHRKSAHAHTIPPCTPVSAHVRTIPPHALQACMCAHDSPSCIASLHMHAGFPFTRCKSAQARTIPPHTPCVCPCVHDSPSCPLRMRQIPGNQLSGGGARTCAVGLFRSTSRVPGEMALRATSGMHGIGSPTREEGVNLFSKAPESRTRSSRWKITKERSNLELRNFPTERTINQWKSSPSEVVGAATLDIFKKRLDSHLSEMKSSKVPSNSCSVIFHNLLLLSLAKQVWKELGPLRQGSGCLWVSKKSQDGGCKHLIEAPTPFKMQMSVRGIRFRRPLKAIASYGWAKKVGSGSSQMTSWFFAPSSFSSRELRSNGMSWHSGGLGENKGLSNSWALFSETAGREGSKWMKKERKGVGERRRGEWGRKGKEEKGGKEGMVKEEREEGRKEKGEVMGEEGRRKMNERKDEGREEKGEVMDGEGGREEKGEVMVRKKGRRKRGRKEKEDRDRWIKKEREGRDEGRNEGRMAEERKKEKRKEGERR